MAVFEETRAPAVAGAFYPEDERELREMIAGFLDKAEDVKIGGKLRGLVVPHAGYIYSGPVAAYGYKLLMKQKAQPDKVLLAGPSHYAMFLGVAEGGSTIWKTPLGPVNAASLASKIADRSLVNIHAQAHKPEHSLEVQLPFLQTVLKGAFTIYPLLTGEVNPAVLANALEPLIDDETIFIASSDLSHYYPYERAKKLDALANEAVPNLDFKKMEYVEACGKTGILTLMHIAKSRGWKGKLLDYRNSGDTAGPKDNVVGYGCYAFYK
ncbi:AmmeMemoRadiSam system protein B [Candidatus Micrarchaeota archaeon]|nr:AmmeMemoRadiSam system protein B [Candidatus Micrarchaeota archaeon]